MPWADSIREEERRRIAAALREVFGDTVADHIERLD